MVTLGMVALLTTLAVLSVWQWQARLSLENGTMTAPASADISDEWTRSAAAWVLAQLNAPSRQDASCQPNTRARFRFREVYGRTDGIPRSVFCEARWPLRCQCPALGSLTTVPDRHTAAIAVTLTGSLLPSGPSWRLSVQHGDRRLSVRLALAPLLRPLSDTQECLPQDAVFRTPPSRWNHLPQVRRLTCTPERPCDAELSAAIEAGWQLFHFPQGLVLQGQAGRNRYGTPQQPVLFAIEGTQQWPPDSQVHGLLWHHGPTLSALAAGMPHPAVHGIAKTCGALLQVHPAADISQALQAAATRFTWAPGSWTDQP